MKMKKAILIILIMPFCLMAQDNDSDDLYMDAYIVVADSSFNYYDLREKMIDLSKELSIKIDTMGRGYDESRKLICLPENDSDELYAGGYFPRRHPSEKLSLEHIEYYTKGIEPKGGETIIIVVGIFDNEKDAKISQTKIKSSKAFILNIRIYMGCMH
jgi:hypothetical protein